MNKTPKERYIRKVTKGLWILPRRQREVRREVEDHLDDVAEEQNISQWSDELLAQHFGSPKELRRQFVKGGLPVWAKLLKFGCWSLLALFTLFVLLDLYMLWFFPLHPVMYQIARSDHPYFQTLLYGEGIPNIDIKWQEPGDNRSSEVLAALEPAYRIVRDHQQFKEQARVKHLEEKKEQLAAQGMVGATKEEAIQKFLQDKYSPEMLEQMQQAQQMGMMGMTGLPNLDENEWLLEVELNPFQPSLFPDEKLEEIRDILAVLQPAGEIRIPRPNVSEEEIEYMRKLLLYQENPRRNERPVAPESLNEGTGPMGMRPQWPIYLLSLQSIGNIDIPLQEQIQRAKDLHAAKTYTTYLSLIFSELHEDFRQRKDKNENFDEPHLPASLLTVLARWANKMTDAIHPRPEPSIDALVLQSITDNVGKMLRLQITEISDVQAYEAALLLFAQTEIERILKDMPPWPDAANDPLLPDISSGHFSQLAFARLKLPVQFSRQPRFRWQCSLMQWILPNDSAAYTRYSILKNYHYIFMLTFVSPNVQKTTERYNITVAKQRMAQAWIQISQWHENGKPVSELPDRLEQWKDPFTGEGLRVRKEQETLSLISAGPGDLGEGVNIDDVEKRGGIVWTVLIQ